MHLRSILTLLLFTALVSAVGLFAPGCATIVPPAGGARDSLPPVLLKSSPLNGARDFDDNRIVLTFDEFVDLNNAQQDVIVSPLPVSSPVISRKLNTVNIKLRDSLQPNTTYSINFGNSIVDVNEQNVYRQFTYLFSTGSYIDSFKVSGNVKLAETGAIDTTLTIMLYNTADDSAVFKREPRYIAKTDGNGAFTFRNLPADTFYLYAVKSGGGTYQYRDKSALFAFADSAVITGPQTPVIPLNAYDVKRSEVPVTAAATNRRAKTDRRLKFQTSLKDNQDLLEPLTFTFEEPLRSFDSSKVHFYRDSAYNPITGYRFIADSTQKIYTLQYTWVPGTLYHFVLDKDFATDTLGFQLLREDTISFETKTLEDYGKLNLRLRNYDPAAKQVLQFIQNDQVFASFPITSAMLTKDLFLPGDYSLRVLYDRNGNGIWDPGQFPKRVQPELVLPLERKINIKANSNFPIEIDLKATQQTGKPVKTLNTAQPSPMRR